MKLTKYRWWIIAAVVVVIGGAYWIWNSTQSGKPQIRSVMAEEGKLVASVSATGTVLPVVQVEVGSQVSGTIAGLHADYNDLVEAGQVLAQLEPSLFRTAVVQSEANVLRAGAALREAERAYRRSQELFKQDVVAELDLEAAESTYEQRQAELKQAEASLETAKVNLGHTTIRSPISGVVISRQVDVGQTVAASLQAPTLFTLAQDLTEMQIESKIDEADVGQMSEGLQVSFSVDAFPDERFWGTVSQVRLEPVIEDNVVTYATVIDVSNEDRMLRPGMTANVTIVVAEKTEVLKVPNAALRFRPPPGFGGAGHGQGDGRGGEGPGTADAAAASPERRHQGGPPAAHGGGPPGGDRGGEPGMAGRRGGGTPPKRLFVLGEGEKIRPVMVKTGITDGAFTEIIGGELKPGDQVVVGIDHSSGQAGLSPPPGFGRRRR
jgi:HlyD family secretion protein